MRKIKERVLKYSGKNNLTKKLFTYFYILYKSRSLFGFIHGFKLLFYLSSDKKILKYINKVVNNKKSKSSEINKIIISIARLYRKKPINEKKPVIENVIAGLNVEEVPQFVVREGNNNKISLKQLSSFRASLSMRSRKLQLAKTLPEWVLEDKLKAYQFVDLLGVKRPNTSKIDYSYQNIPVIPGTVIKPLSGDGSKGVYIVHEDNHIIDVKKKKTLRNTDDLFESMKTDLKNGGVKQDKWFYEEIIYEDVDNKIAGRDLKFYCFYGKVALILEIVRFPEEYHCMWTTDGEKIRSRIYEKPSFNGAGVTKEEIDMVSKISCEIPTPFIRIDFIRSNNGLVFGEFTPRPGSYDTHFDNIDKWLGDLFLEAEERLTMDLLKGKKFLYYDKISDL